MRRRPNALSPTPRTICRNCGWVQELEAWPERRALWHCPRCAYVQLIGVIKTKTT